MKKVLFHFLTVLILFLSIWFMLSRINWITLFGIEQTTLNTEEKLGDLIWEMVKRTETEVKSDRVIKPIDTLLNTICIKNKLDKSAIKLHILYKDEVNAFALPGNRLVIYSRLINSCENEAELAGVLSHELAHIQKKHVMQKLIKEIGLGALASLTTGNAETLKQVFKLLSSTAYDRRLETEADKTAVIYLINARINPVNLSDFLLRISKKESDFIRQFSWVSTHPDSKERALEIRRLAKPYLVKYKSILNDNTWKTLQQKTAEEPASTKERSDISK